MKLSNLNILLTGGAGFIGSSIATILARNNTVTIYDNFISAVMTPKELIGKIPDALGGATGGTTGGDAQDFEHRHRPLWKSSMDKERLGLTDAQKFRASQSRIQVIHGDILDEKKLARAMKGMDLVIAFAATGVRISLTTPKKCHDVNATGTLNTLMAAKKAQVKRFVYISSSEVYGSAEEPYIKETHAIHPATVYGMSKYVAETYARHFNEKEGLPTVIVRPFNTYGPRCHFNGVYGEVIPRFIVRALNGKQPMIFGDGSQTRDFTYLDDTVAGILLAASSDSLTGPVNIACGREISINHLARTICKLAHIPFKPIYQSPRPQDVARHAADITKAKKLLKFTPSVSIEVGLGRYITWLQRTYPNVKKLERLVPDKNW